LFVLGVGALFVLGGGTSDMVGSFMDGCIYTLAAKIKI
jgi:hypothetical protein